MSKGGGSQTVTQRTEIPDFLRPFAEAQAGIGLEALRGLAGRLSGAPASRFAAPPARTAAPQPVMRPGGLRRGGRGSDNGFRQLLQPRLEAPAQEVLPPIPGASAEDLVAGFNPDQLAAINLARQRAQGAGGFIPTAQQEFLETAQGRDISSFVDPAALGALQRTASGDFLFGGEGFRAAVDAAVRAAQPNILSTFGAAGRGTGGLAQTAIAQAATDAFARQHGQARQQQLAAAGLLGEFGQSERARQLQAAGVLPSLAFADTDALFNIGGIQQGQAQRELTAPITALESLLAAAGGPVGLQGLFGRSTTQPIHSNTGAGILGGLSGGLGLGALTAAEGATGLAALGGPLGIGLGVGGALLGGLLS